MTARAGHLPLPGVDEIAALPIDQSRLNRVRARAEALKVEREAKEQVEAEEAARLWKPPVKEGIATFLATEPAVPSFHVDGLWPHGGTVVLEAAKKWGKSTMMRNLVESVIGGAAFLHRFEVTAPFTRAVVIDMELTHRQAWNYWHGAALRDDQMELWRLRGSAGTMALRDPRVRGHVVAKLRDSGADLVVLDPLGPVLRVCGFEENSNDDVGRLLDIWDEVLSDAGVTASVIPHHMGHGAERARGASVIGDKADAIWTGTYAVQGEDSGPRFLKARGRDVELESSQVDYDPVTRAMTMSLDPTRRSDVSKSKREEKKVAAEMERVAQAKAALEANPSGFPSVRALKDYLGVTWDGTRCKAIRETLEAEGLIQRGVPGFIPPGESEANTSEPIEGASQ